MVLGAHESRNAETGVQRPGYNNSLNALVVAGCLTPLESQCGMRAPLLQLNPSILPHPYFRRVLLCGSKLA